MGDKEIELVGPVYAYPPAHIDREAWTAEWKDSGERSITGTIPPFAITCSKCGSAQGAKFMKFCPSCGRAMTPEAWDELENRVRGDPLLQNMQNASIADMQYELKMMQLQQCCCSIGMVNTSAMMGVQNAVSPYFHSYSQPEEAEKEDIIYKLDKILFPDNPIREYIASEVKKVIEKYKERIRLLNSVI